MRIERGMQLRKAVATGYRIRDAGHGTRVLGSELSFTHIKPSPQ
jgi:hypothetical protein